MKKNPPTRGLEDQDQFGEDDADNCAGSTGDCDDDLSMLTKKILALKAQIRRRDKDISLLREANEKTVDQKLRALVDEAGELFTQNGRGRKMLSARSDMLCSNLRSMGCSVEKLPEILENSLSFFVGHISPEIKKEIIPSSRTIAGAISRAMATHVALNRLHVVNDVQAICVEADKSNKKNKDWMSMPYTLMGDDNIVKLNTFRFTETHSAKVDQVSQAMIYTVTNDIGAEGAMRIKGGCADNKGLGELVRLLQHTDDLRMAYNNNTNVSPESKQKFLVVNSMTNEATPRPVTYNCGMGPFASQRSWNCTMHSIQRVFVDTIDEVLGPQAVKHTAPPGQTTFRTGYYITKCRPELDCLLFECIDEDISDWDALPSLLKNNMKVGVAGRWLTQEDACRNTIAVVNVPADDRLLDIVLEGKSQAEQDNLKTICCCIDDTTKPSALLLMFNYIGNHSAGNARNGEKYQNLHEISGGLCNPVNRVVFKIGACLYVEHRKIAAFADGKTRIEPGNTQTYGTRMLEVVTFFRTLLGFLSRLSADWKQVMPEAVTLMSSEIIREQRINGEKNYNSDQIQPTSITMIVEERMQECRNIMVKAVKYYVDPLLERGFSILALLDPFLATFWAMAALEAMHLHHGCPVTPEQRASWIKFPAEAGPDDCYSQDSAFFAFPGLTFKQYHEKILRSFNGKTPQILAILHGYGIIGPAFRADLSRVATGYIKTTLLQKGTWQPGDGTHTIWVWYEQTLSAAAHSLKTNFSYMLLTGAIVEQTFTIATTQLHANMSAATVQDAMYHMVSLRTPAIHTVVHTSSSGDSDQQPRRANRSNDSRAKVSMQLEMVAEEHDKIRRDQGPDVAQSEWQLVGSKRKSQVIQSAGRVRSEFDANKRPEQHVFSSINILETNSRYAKAQITKSLELPAEEFGPYVAESKNSCWSKALLLEYLREHCHIVVPESTRMRPKDDDEVDYKCLQKLLLEHWQEIQFPAEQLASLLQYVKENKTLPLVVAIGQPMEDVVLEAN
jgi:hypothetical protein